MKKQQLEKISDGLFAELTIDQKRRVAGGALCFSERKDGSIEVHVD
jgi:hypothetical protein